MRDYESVAKSLRCCVSDSEPCEHCNCELEECNPKTIMEIAADAIEELLARDVVPTDFHERCLQLEISKRIELEKQIPHWISVEERLPEPGERVLVSNGGFVCESFLSQSGKWQRGGVDMFFMTPTHWMPLPKEPKED